MSDKVFSNGRAAIHAGSAGKSIAFPDVCLCPPPPPSGPVPTPLPNTAQAAERQIKGRIFAAGRVSLRQIAKGSCEIVMPDADARADELGQPKPAKATGDQKTYVPGSPLRLATGKEYVGAVHQIALGGYPGAGG